MPWEGVCSKAYLPRCECVFKGGVCPRGGVSREYVQGEREVCVQVVHPLAYCMLGYTPSPLPMNRMRTSFADGKYSQGDIPVGYIPPTCHS